MTVEPAALLRLLQTLVPDAQAIQIESVTKLTGGWSTDTFRVQGRWERSRSTQTLDVVVRRILPEGVLAPYDIAREHRILEALQDSPVPVPEVLGCDAAGDHLDGPCLVTAYVEGEPLSFFGRTIAPDDERLPSHFATLAAIHSLDWRARDLQFLDEAADALEGELLRSESRLGLHGAVATAEQFMLDWLRVNKPLDTTKALLHGDPNLANYIVAGTQVAAVVDWELAVVGDPRIDLGFFAAIQSTLGDTWQLDTHSFLRGYAAANPAANLEHLDYFEVIGLLRVAGFLRTSERRMGMDVALPRSRLHARFEQITAGK